MTLGQKIKEARIERGLTQKQLVGDYITRNMLSKIENDSATPSVRTLEYLAKALEMPVSYFLEDTEISDGSSADGLDNMRDAYRAGKWEDCIRLLEEEVTIGTTDEGYLLHARAAAAAARESLSRGNLAEALGFAEVAKYYNKEGIYYSHRIDAEMSLVLAENALWTGGEEFDISIRQYERAAMNITYFNRYMLDKAEYALIKGEPEDARDFLEKANGATGALHIRYVYLTGRLKMLDCNWQEAIEILRKAEELGEGNPLLLPPIYQHLELCYKELENYKMAYYYASKQLR